MKGGLSAIQQTLTPEASTVLTHSISEAARRSHGQTTPLHVAATLLSSPAGLLRQACIRSHPNSSHPLQCRALELCFSVALDRLPTTSASSQHDQPPLSNALVAALKRAQGLQRRGCPEQQQQPLLAVKVELEQLIISILDDPSVSRVMKEASFSSPAVKSAIEQLHSQSQPAQVGLGLRAGLGGGRSLYLNPRLQQGSSNNNNVGPMQPGHGREEDVKKVIDILSRPGKRNPVLVGESEPREVAKEALNRVEKIHDGVLKDVEVVCLEKEFGGVDKILGKVKELGGLIERKMLETASSCGLVVDLGDLKWLVDQPVSLGVSEVATQAVVEIGRVLTKFGQGGRRVWLIGTATCETYLRCQVYHPTMETDWDLQVVSIVAKAKTTLPGVLPRLGSSGGILSSSVECLTPMKGFQIGASPLIRRVSENLDPRTKSSCCPQCTDKCNEEITNLTVQGQPEKSSSEMKTDTTPPKPLPFWLQNARLSNNDSAQNKDQDLILRRQKEELQKKWSNTCLQLHPSFHGGASSERIIPSPLSVTGLYMNPNLLRAREPPQQPKLLQQPKILGETLQLNISPPSTHQSNPPSPPRSPVRTDLLLGPSKSPENLNRATNVVGGDTDSFKKLLKGLMEKVSWQKEAASMIASTITRCKSGGGRSRKGDIWLLFSGPDRIGKNKMAAALSELVCGAGPVIISLGSRREGDESDLNFRGKTAIDRIAEAVRRNPFSVIVLRDIDEADVLVRGTVKRAMERGRLVDSHGREISLGNIVFVVTVNSMPGQQGVAVTEEKLASIAIGGWQLRISVGENPTTGGKRAFGRSHHEEDEDDQCRASKLQRTFDLNQMADVEDDRLDGSHNSSDLTVEHGEEHAPQNRGLVPPQPPAVPSSTVVQELLGCVDEVVSFKAVDLGPVKVNIERTIMGKFSATLGEKMCLKIEHEALEKITSGLWLGQADVESWVEKALLPGFHQLKTTLGPRGPPPMVARLELDHESGSRGQGDWLPGSVSVVANL